MTTVRSNTVWPLEPWNAVNYYGIGSLANHMSGVWETLTANRNSQPSGGNSRWKLASATFLQVTDLTATQMATLGSNPPVLVPAPTMGRALTYLMAWSQQQPNTIPFLAAAGLSIVYAGDTNILDTNGDLLGTGAGPAPRLHPFNYDVAPNGGAGTILKRSIVEGKALVGFGGTDDPSGAIEDPNVSVGTGGLGYAINDTGLINIGGGDGIAYRVTAIGAGGAVTGFTITVPPGLPDNWGVSVGAGQATVVSTGGGDGNFTVNVNSVISANGTARVWVLCGILELP